MMQINVPDGMEILRSPGGVRVRATADRIIEISEQLRSLSLLASGGFALLGDVELVVSDRPSRLKNRIGMPAKAWNILASKFIEVATGREEPVFYFNECGYLTGLLPVDLGVELVGDPKQE